MPQIAPKPRRDPYQGKQSGKIADEQCFHDLISDPVGGDVSSLDPKEADEGINQADQQNKRNHLDDLSGDRGEKKVAEIWRIREKCLEQGNLLNPFS